MSKQNDLNVKGFAVTDGGFLPDRSTKAFPLAKRFSPRVFATRDAADRFVMTLPKSVRRDVLVVTVMR